MRDIHYIINTLQQELTEKMVRDADQYADGHKELGIKGQFADIWRKVSPLKRALWDGYELPREQPREILMDLIGHCYLTIAMIDREAREADLAEARTRP